jgi:hypothetical protein
MWPNGDGFEFDGDVVKAAIADGRSREEAQYLPVWLGNENSRLRTLPVAAGFKADLFPPCDETPSRAAPLEQPAATPAAASTSTP